jgi:hypothetical protein
MKLARLIAITGTALLFLGDFSAATAADDPAHWGDAVNGLRLGIDIGRSVRTEFHPGEVVQITVEVKPQRAIRLPKTPDVDQFIEIHVRTPDGRESIWASTYPSESKAEPRRIREWNDKLSQGNSARTYELRLDESHNWLLDFRYYAPSQRQKLSLRAAGNYSVWAECNIEADSDAPKNGWRGHIKSGVINLQVREMSIEKRRLTLTDDQKRLIEALLAYKDHLPGESDEVLPVTERIRKELMLTSNEGLANRLFQLVKEDRSGILVKEALGLLNWRAGTIEDGEHGIDGPYLKDLAQWELDVSEGKVPAPPSLGAAHEPYQGTVEHALLYLRFHPDEQKMRQQLIDLAQRSFKIVEHKDDERPNLFYSSIAYSNRAPMAFRALYELEVLTEGMALEKAVEALGAPAKQLKETAEWHWKLQHSESPFNLGVLLARVRDGKLSGWYFYWRPEQVFAGSQLPPALVQAVKKKFPKAEIVRARLDKVLLDTNFWSVEAKVDGQQIQIGVDEISGSHQVNTISKAIALENLPKPVTEALHAKYPHAALKSAREVLSGLIALPPGKTKPPDYELSIITADKKARIVRFTPEMRTKANGEVERHPEKMVFLLEIDPKHEND